MTAAKMSQVAEVEGKTQSEAMLLALESLGLAPFADVGCTPRGFVMRELAQREAVTSECTRLDAYGRYISIRL